MADRIQTIIVEVHERIGVITQGEDEYTVRSAVTSVHLPTGTQIHVRLPQGAVEGDVRAHLRTEAAVASLKAAFTD